MRVLVVDNYDSFTFNLVQMIESHPEVRCRVVRSDAEPVDRLLEWNPDRIVLSPGPFGPDRTGVCGELVERAGPTPILGVCLGMQVIAAGTGARVVPSGRPVHGKTRSVDHDGSGSLAGVPSPTDVGLYHSLVVDPGSVDAGALAITARAIDGGTIMGVRLPGRPVEGFLFHPESFLTREGDRMIDNFLGGARVE